MTDLERTRDHARSKATHPDTPSNDRYLWAQIADEIDQYLNSEIDEYHGGLEYDDEHGYHRRTVKNVPDTEGLFS